MRRWIRPLRALGAVLVAALILWAMARHEIAELPARLDREKGGIMGVYYHGSAFQHLVGQRVDRMIAFNTTGSIHTRLQPDNFSVTWRGFVRTGKSERLCLEAGSAIVKLYLDERFAFDAGLPTGHEQRCIDFAESDRRARWHRIRVEYSENEGATHLMLLHDVPGHRKELVAVKPNDLCCAPVR